MSVTGYKKCERKASCPNEFPKPPLTFDIQVPAAGCQTSDHKRPGRPTDSQQAFSPARPGQGERDLGFSEQTLGKFHMTGQCFISVWLTSENARRYLKVASDI